MSSLSARPESRLMPDHSQFKRLSDEVIWAGATAPFIFAGFTSTKPHFAALPGSHLDPQMFGRSDPSRG